MSIFDDSAFQKDLEQIDYVINTYSADLNAIDGVDNEKNVSIEISDSDDELVQSKTSAKIIKSIEIISSSDESSLDIKACECIELNEHKKLLTLPDLRISSELAGDNVEIGPKISKKEEREAIKKQKHQERMQKKEELLKQNAVKNALKDAKKNYKPEECIKKITVTVDKTIADMPYGKDICEGIHNVNANYIISSQIISNTVTWQFNDPTLITEAPVVPLNENVVMLIVSSEEIANSQSQSILLTYADNVATVFKGYTKILLLLGMANYYKQHPKKRKTMRQNLEENLCEIQVIYEISCWFAESYAEVSKLIVQFTKAVAKTVASRWEKSKSDTNLSELSAALSSEKVESVRVDKDGNGVRRLYQQQLTCFPLARVETAQSVMEVYPNLNSLMQAYEECQEEGERATLLRDLTVRRAARGVTSAARRLGPELSRKMAVFYGSNSNGTNYVQQIV